VSQHAVGSLESLPNNAGFKLEIADERIAIFRVDDAVYAIGDRCSHAEASLSEGELFDLEVECPRHGAEFDITTGKQLSLPATKPVPTYETAIRDGQVFVTIADEDTNE
jgi:3-phenylpropionate/trans-cinnamate dioxygenase ferredoxin subunit